MIKDLPSFLAGDQTILKEVLHPKNDQITINLSIAYASLKGFEKSLPHTLSSDEVYIFLSGEGRIFIDEKEIPVAPYVLACVEAGEKQFVVNDTQEELSFLCIVTPPWNSAGEEIHNT